MDALSPTFDGLFFMNRIFTYLAISLIILNYFGCKEEDIISVSFDGYELIPDTNPLNSAMKTEINGIYNVLEGKDRFGEKVVVKWSGDTLSLFTGKNYANFILRGGYQDSAVIFEGEWKYAFEEQIYLARLFIRYDEGGKEIINGIDSLSEIIFRGHTGTNPNNLTSPFAFELERQVDFSESDFAILAHRGGSSSNKCIPEAENSLSMIRLAEKYGANGIEIDIRLSKDKVPILFHDDNFTERVIDGQFFIGPVSNYTYSHIQSFCKLKNGETIPTLREALDVVLHETKLNIVWLDIKSAEAIHKLMPIQLEYLKKAESMGRKLEILMGLAMDETVNAYLSNTNHGVSPAICELDFALVRKTDAQVWAPRWTLGPLVSEIDEMHRENRKVYIWTVDKPEALNIFMSDLKADGILTNYPNMVAYEYYTKYQK
ncbi:glycerophosphodiester phosphodiesterase [Bacteroidota bacterium]